MPGQLISGPAGGGKSAAARAALLAVGAGVVIDFQAIYAALLLLERDEDTGRYPERLERHSYLLPLAEYTRRAMLTGALQNQLFPILTNSDGDPGRRRELLDLMGDGATETILDPGRAEVERRLSRGGRLSSQCGQAVDRWYLRL